MGNNPGEKYLAAIAPEGKVDNETLIKFIEENSSISQADITILFDALAEVITENITIGRGVNFENLGIFSPNLRTKGSLNEEEVTADNIQQVVVNFRPSSKFRKEMDNEKVSETKKFNLKHV